MASIVDTSVKHAYSSMTGALVINGTAGSLNAALKAFLVTGWGAKAVDSAAISNGVCRLTFASGKSAAELHTVIQVSGATPGGLNGEQRVTAVASGWVEFKTDLPDGAVTGSISFKMAGLGWEEVYSKTNVSVFRPVDPASSRLYYRFDDSNALYARLQMFESMTDVDTGLAGSPLTVAGGYYWHKRASGAAATYWVLAGDSRGFYALLFPYSSSGATNANVAGSSYYAGDLNSYRSGDAWCGVLTGMNNTSLSDVGCIFCTATSLGLSLKRMAHGVGGAVQALRRYLGSAAVSGADGYLGGFPSAVDNSLRLSPIMITDALANPNPRGEMPGAYHCPQSGVLNALGWDVLLTKGQGVFNGKQLLSAHVGAPGSTAQGLGFIDVTGPWRG